MINLNQEYLKNPHSINILLEIINKNFLIYLLNLNKKYKNKLYYVNYLYK